MYSLQFFVFFNSFIEWHSSGLKYEDYFSDKALYERASLHHILILFFDDPEVAEVVGSFFYIAETAQTLGASCYQKGS